MAENKVKDTVPQQMVPIIAAGNNNILWAENPALL